MVYDIKLLQVQLTVKTVGTHCMVKLLIQMYNYHSVKQGIACFFFTILRTSLCHSHDFYFGFYTAP